MRIAIALLLVACSFSSLSAQEIISELDVSLQGEFIDANREKLLGNYKKAADAYKGILKKDRSNHAAHYELARVLAKLDRNDEAQKAIKEAVELNNSNIWYQFFQAELYEKMSDDRRAAEVYAGLVKRYPENEKYYFKQAFYHVRARDIDNAISVYDALEKRIGLTEEIVRRKHTLHMGSGDLKKASKELERLTTAFPKNLEYQHLLANFYKQSQQKDKAKSIYRRILELDPSDAKATLALQSKKNSTNNALIPIFQDADIPIDLKMKELFPYIERVASGDKSDLETGVALAKTLTEVHPQNAKGFAAYGDLLYHSGDLPKAQKQYEQTLELDDTVYAVWEQLMYIHWEQAQFAELDKVSETAMDIFPNQGRVYYMNAVAKNNSNAYDDALEMLEEAQFMTGKDVRMKFDVLAQMGAAYYGMQEFGEAKRVVESALEINSQAYSLVEKYGDILFQLEDTSAAVEQWKRAKKLGGNSADLERKISDKKL